MQLRSLRWFIIVLMLLSRRRDQLPRPRCAVGCCAAYRGRSPTYARGTGHRVQRVLRRVFAVLLRRWLCGRQVRREARARCEHVAAVRVLADSRRASLVKKMGSLIVVRVIFGAGEGPYATCTNKMISGWFERNKQASAVGYANAGQQFGGAIAGPIVGMLALSVGWRCRFVVIAALGLVLGRCGHCWSPTVRKRTAGLTQSPRIIATTRPLNPHRSPKTTAGRSARGCAVHRFLRRPRLYGPAYILYFFLSWFLSYLTMERHLSPAVNELRESFHGRAGPSVLHSAV